MCGAATRHRQWVAHFLVQVCGEHSLKNIACLDREADCLALRRLEETRIDVVTRELGFVRRQFFLDYLAPFHLSIGHNDERSH